MSQEVFLPNELKEHKPVHPKLGIKSSLSNIDELIIFVILLWKSNENVSEIKYSKQIGNGIEIEDRVLDTIELFLHKESIEYKIENSTFNIMSITKDEIKEELNKNPLFTLQFEPIYVPLCLYFKLANLKFVGEYNSASERTQGKRLEKIIQFTTNMDLIDNLLDNDINSFKGL